MSTAEMHIAVVEFTCPKCKEHISNEDGSHMFQLHEIPEILCCETCGAKLKAPTKALKLKGTNK